ncbi:LysR family transcriptional regulator [Gordonia sp. HY002]|uniref:LysR family transcriptional regulator n=1 Tax=Gordonia zhenghanii TaxID=2911516 RepID=UPI001EF144A2|nr:LysR family transcriptional regulator [Gordonia zhenghanii]MCF8571003.1 LysR family transcriptional regulator [Gordonia zhenghanii]MCF8607483.1 LysR family transcriptional regulator [Gordonia zhenghanii]
MDQWTVELAPQLRALTALADHDGFMTGAAESLGIPQSSMSRRIHALEQTLRIPLISRDGRAVRLTPAARRLAETVRGPLAELEAAVAEVTDDADPEHGTVRFGFPLTMGHGTVPDLLADFNRAHPGIRLQLKQAHGAELVDDLRHGELDLALTIPPPDGLPHTVVATQEIRATVPATHRLAVSPRIDLADLADDRFIANPRTYNLRLMTEAWCQAVGFDPQIAVEITEFSTIREFVGLGLGVALLPVTDDPADGTVQIPLSGEHRRTVGLASATARLAPAARRLSDFIVQRSS